MKCKALFSKKNISKYHLLIMLFSTLLKITVNNKCTNLGFLLIKKTATATIIAITTIQPITIPATSPCGNDDEPPEKLKY